ncbi:MAG: prepilin-type N-terminal cleavage/methylation domain-containing protein [Heliobacteriaceae bacterium]|nr:prepilin-type N-terminal cleavage/methylation domain-containing protein [Heliobacteriaceae bacterium]MDD4587186.1 prepilin-type N-terminal cleavage/methylation domain-containing protein [Heliobacteriaceae bacterium]
MKDFYRQQGATLVEVVVAVTLLGLAFAPLFSALIVADRLEQRAAANTQALCLAEQLLERKRAALKLGLAGAADSGMVAELPAGYSGEVTVMPVNRYDQAVMWAVTARVWQQAGVDCRLTTWVCRRGSN